MPAVAAGAAALAVAKGITVTVASALIVAGLKNFADHFNGAHEVWHCGPAEAAREIEQLKGRKNDKFPQGYNNCMKFLQLCQANRMHFTIKAVHTMPWTWYYEAE